MPFPIIFAIAAAIGLSATATVVVLSCWDRIVTWTKSAFLPWVDNYLPELSDLARKAFMSVHAVVREVRVAVRDAWSSLRTRLVKQLVEFSRGSANQWVVRTTSWVIASLSPDGSPQVVQHETTRSVSLDEIPPELLEGWLERTENNVTFDLLAIRDKEIAEMEMQLGEEDHR